MSRSKLVVEQEFGEIRLFWYFPEDGDIGGELEKHTENDLKEAQRRFASANTDQYEMALEDLEAVAAGLAASKSPGVMFSGSRMSWETVAQAKTALKHAKVAIKIAKEEALSGRAWPQWALEASKAGWKPPKGWRP